MSQIFIIPTDTCYGLACPFDDKKSYEKIYDIKKRPLSKPLAILVEDFTWLRNNTELTEEQIEFLEHYDRPFTVLTESSPVRLFLEYHSEDEEYYINKDVYTQLSFRVAHNDIQKRLIREYGPLWLTSANLSGKAEIYSASDIQKEFAYYLDASIAELRGTVTLDSSTQSSDVFGFEDNSVDQIFVRKR